MKALVSVCAIGVLTLSSQAFACGFEGTAVRKDGSKVDGTARISTSWNGNQAYPRNGRYSLELGNSACGQSMEVYVDGNGIGRYTLPNSGMKRLDVVVR
jgi:hypothetical protein